MKKNIWIAIIVLIILAGGGWIWYQWTRQPAHAPQTNTQTNENQNMKLPNEEKVLRTAILMVEKGEVSLQRQSETETVTDSAVLKEGDMVTTKADSKATIVFADDSIVRLNENTQLYLTVIDLESENKTIDMMQSFGETWHKVENFMSGDLYTVQHGNTIVGVRGTVFDMQVREQNKVLVSVISHKVEVADRLAKKSEEILENSAFLYDEKQHVFKVSEKLYKELSSTDWFEVNRKADKAIQELEQKVENVFDYYLDEKNLTLFTGEVIQRITNENINALLEWWDNPNLYQKLPPEYLRAYEEGMKAYEKYIQTIGNMNINWQEYEKTLQMIENMNLNVSIPDDVYNAIDSLKNLNVNFTPPDMPDLNLLDVPANIPSIPVVPSP